MNHSFLLSLALAAVFSQPLAGKPNIVFFFVDDMGWQDTSVPFHSETTQLNRDYRTPHMEKLAAEDPATDRSQRPLFWNYPNLYYLPPYSAVRLGDHKLICWYATGKLELFNLREDLGERHDLSQKEPATTSKLATLLSNHLRTAKADLPMNKASGMPVPIRMPSSRNSLSRNHRDPDGATPPRPSQFPARSSGQRAIPRCAIACENQSR